jgi:hypothetical protein
VQVIVPSAFVVAAAASVVGAELVPSAAGLGSSSPLSTPVSRSAAPTTTTTAMAVTRMPMLRRRLRAISARRSSCRCR